MLPPPPTSTLFPYTTLFRSGGRDRQLALRRQRLLPSLRQQGLRPQRGRLGGEGRVAHHHPAEAAAREPALPQREPEEHHDPVDRKSTRLNSSHPSISYAVFC